MAEKKSATVTYLGDEDASVQSVEMFGRTFVKGEPVTLKSTARGFDKITANPTFSAESNPDLVEADEPEPPNPDEGTELQALRDQLDAAGVKYRPNEGPDSLRSKLAKHAEASAPEA